MSVDWFNDLFPVGTPVVAYPGTRDDEGLATRTRSEAWLLGGHTAVVLVERHAGGIALTHVDVLTEGVPEPYSCADCGTPRAAHGRRWSQQGGMHAWKRPSDALIKSRMLTRRAVWKDVCRCVEPWQQQPFAPVVDPWKCEAAECRMHDYLIGGWLKPLSFDEAMDRFGGGS